MGTLCKDGDSSEMAKKVLEFEKVSGMGGSRKPSLLLHSLSSFSGKGEHRWRTNSMVSQHVMDESSVGSGYPKTTTAGTAAGD